MTAPGMLARRSRVSIKEIRVAGFAVPIPTETTYITEDGLDDYVVEDGSDEYIIE